MKLGTQYKEATTSRQAVLAGATGSGTVFHGTATRRGDSIEFDCSSQGADALYSKAKEVSARLGMTPPGYSSSGNKYSSQGSIHFRGPPDAIDKAIYAVLSDLVFDGRRGVHAQGTTRLEQDWVDEAARLRADRQREHQQSQAAIKFVQDTYRAAENGNSFAQAYLSGYY